MKWPFYNPFRRHVVKIGDKYAVRRLSLFYFGWVYQDARDHFEWNTVRHVYSYCMLDTKEAAFALVSVGRAERVVA